MEHSSRANRESHFKKLLGQSLVVRRSRDKMACEEPVAIKNFVLDTINVFYKHTINTIMKVTRQHLETNEMADEYDLLILDI